MEMVNIKINNMPLSVPKGISILEAARMAGIEIPTLCYLKKINEIGACRICMVEVKGARSLVTACVYPVNEGMEIFTNTERVRKSRKMTLELILSTHDRKCLSCVRSGTCELQQLCKEFGVDDEGRFDGANPVHEYDDSAIHMIRDNGKCILCRRCVAACQAQHISVIGANARGFDTHIGSAFERPLDSVACVSCGQCIVNCPTGAIYEKDDTAKVLEAINDPEKFVVVHTAPSIRVTLGECFGMHIGTNVQGKMVAALRRLGFDKVFDTDFGADLTIVEEASEFLGRVQNGGVLPMITSCSPGWIKYCEHYYPDMLDHLSTCKSPQQMSGAIIKTWYAEKMGIDPKDIVSVSIMPCTAKKFEVGRDDQDAAGVADVDIALTTRELARMIERCGIDFVNLPDEEFDSPLGEDTGAAVIFGGVILRRYGRTLIVARSQVLAETIVLDLANLAQQRLVELFGRRPVVSTPVKDQQLLGLRAVPNDIVRAIQTFQQAFHGIVVVPCLVGNLLDADLVTAAEIGVRIGHAVEIDVPILGRKVIDDLAVRPKVHADIPIARHSVHLLR